SSDRTEIRKGRDFPALLFCARLCRPGGKEIVMRFVVLGLLVIAGLNPATAQEGRTFVERLELDTPEEAVQSFIDAFAAKDFLAAYFMLTPPARNQFTNTYYSFNVASYFNTEGTGWIAGSVYDAS